MINYSELMTKARRKGRYNLIDYLRYRLQNRYALFTEKVDLEGNVGVTIIDDIGTLEDA